MHTSRNEACVCVCEIWMPIILVPGLETNRFYYYSITECTGPNIIRIESSLTITTLNFWFVSQKSLVRSPIYFIPDILEDIDNAIKYHGCNKNLTLLFVFRAHELPQTKTGIYFSALIVRLPSDGMNGTGRPLCTGKRPTRWCAGAGGHTCAPPKKIFHSHFSIRSSACNRRIRSSIGHRHWYNTCGAIVCVRCGQVCGSGI